MIESPHTNSKSRAEILSDLEGMMMDFPTSKLLTLSRFLKNVVETESVSKVEAFLTWKDHQVIDTILLLLADMEPSEQEAITSAVRNLLAEDATE